MGVEGVATVRYICLLIGRGRDCLQCGVYVCEWAVEGGGYSAVCMSVSSCGRGGYSAVAMSVIRRGRGGYSAVSMPVSGRGKGWLQCGVYVCD